MSGILKHRNKNNHMDSLTQFVLGAAVSTACLGKTLGPRKAAILGGVLGTLPDLDVLLPFDDPVDSFVLHRGWTHSLVTHALAAPVLGELLVRLVKSLRNQRALIWLTVFLCLSTHALIDAMTVYGTRLLWPLYPDPVGVGSIFIIDPLYTLPLLGVVVWALMRRDWSARLGRWLAGALVVTTGYMGLSIGLQAHIENRAKQVFARAGLEPERVFAIAAPFNTVLWKVIGLEEGRYHNLYLSLLDNNEDARIYSHPRHPELVACLGDVDAFRKLEWFSRGFYRADQVEDKIVVSDLRMGLTPGYVFSFAIAEVTGTDVMAISPRRDLSHRTTTEGDFNWLGDRILGVPAVRAAEVLEPEAGADSSARAC